MDKIYKELKKAQQATEMGIEPISELFSPHSSINQQQTIFQKERQLSLEEKKFLLATERGDIATVKYYLDEANTFEKFNMNAVDPLGRSALRIAIEYENIEMIEVLLNYHVDVGEALLHAINEEFVEAVEMLLHYQDNAPVDVSLNFDFKKAHIFRCV
jgi:transient receptor potential cation channel subfamily C protein 4